MATFTDAQWRQGGQENLLLDYVRRLENYRDGRQIVHLHLSRLMPFNRREQHIRAAANTFEPLIQARQGQLFMMRDADLFFIFKAESRGQVEGIVQRIRFLFSDDPMLGEEAVVQRDFATWYDVDKQYDDILAAVQGRAEHELKREDEKFHERDATRATLAVRQSDGVPLTPDVLGRIEKALDRADLSSMVRRQFICRLSRELVPELLFSELFISISDLRETLIPDVNLASNRWLFQHLTETLDRRMLAMVNRNDTLAISGDISFNLNVSTLLSQEFLDFDDNVTASRRGTMVIELQKVDVFSDLGAFFFAREFVQSRGYRVCIDGLTHLTLPLIDRERLGADFLKVLWNPEMAESDDQELIQMRLLVSRAGSGRVVLCRVDNPEGITFGQAAGISLFQGRHVEALVAEDSRRRELLKLKKGRVYR